MENRGKAKGEIGKNNNKLRTEKKQWLGQPATKTASGELIFQRFAKASIASFLFILL